MPRGPAHAAAASEPGDPVPTPDWMTEEGWEASCDATAALDDEPPGFGEEDEEEEEPDPEPGERIWGTAGFADGGFADALPGGSALARSLGTATGTRALPMPSWTG